MGGQNLTHALQHAQDLKNAILIHTSARKGDYCKLNMQSLAKASFSFSGE